MSERIQDIATQAWKKTSDEIAYLNRIHNRSLGHDETIDIFEIKFAELIVRECVEVLRMVPYDCDGPEFGDEIVYQEAVKKHFGIEE